MLYCADVRGVGGRTGDPGTEVATTEHLAVEQQHVESCRVVRSSGTDETISKCRTFRSLARRRRLVSEGVE